MVINDKVKAEVSMITLPNSNIIVISRRGKDRSYSYLGGINATRITPASYNRLWNVLDHMSEINHYNETITSRLFTVKTK